MYIHVLTGGVGADLHHCRDGGTKMIVIGIESIGSRNLKGKVDVTFIVHALHRQVSSFVHHASHGSSERRSGGRLWVVGPVAEIAIQGRRSRRGMADEFFGRAAVGGGGVRNHCGGGGDGDDGKVGEVHGSRRG